MKNIIASQSADLSGEVNSIVTAVQQKKKLQDELQGKIEEHVANVKKSNKQVSDCLSEIQAADEQMNKLVEQMNKLDEQMNKLAKKKQNLTTNMEGY